MSMSLCHLEKRKLMHALFTVYNFQGLQRGVLISSLRWPVTGHEEIEQSCVRECSEWVLEGSSPRVWLVTAMISPGKGSWNQAHQSSRNISTMLLITRYHFSSTVWSRARSCTLMGPFKFEVVLWFWKIFLIKYYLILMENSLNMALYKDCITIITFFPVTIDMRKALSRDTEKKSVIPLPHPVRPEDIE